MDTKTEIEQLKARIAKLEGESAFTLDTINGAQLHARRSGKCFLVGHREYSLYDAQDLQEASDWLLMLKGKLEGQSK